jgi:flagellar FliJ protein
MPPFAFRLEPVLGHRKRLEDAQQVVFAAALSALQAAEAVRADYVARRSAMHERLHKHHREMDVAELRAAYAHCAFLDRSIVAQEVVIEQARVKVDRERLTLIGKTQDKKVLEVLKERRRETFEFEAATAEQLENDEINSRRYDRAATPRENPS